MELYAGVMEAESLLEEKPELKEELDGLLSVYEISIRQNGEPVEIKDSAMTVRIPMNSHLEGYAHYQAVRVDGEPERIKAKAEDGSLVFEAGGPGRYAVLGSDTPFSVSAIIQPDPLPGDEKDGNAVYIVLLAAIPAAVLLMLASCGGVLGMASGASPKKLLKRKRAPGSAPARSAIICRQRRSR